MTSVKQGVHPTRAGPEASFGQNGQTMLQVTIPAGSPNRALRLSWERPRLLLGAPRETGQKERSSTPRAFRERALRERAETEKLNMNRITENNWLQKEHASSLNDGGTTQPVPRNLRVERECVRWRGSASAGRHEFLRHAREVSHRILEPDAWQNRPVLATD